MGSWSASDGSSWNEFGAALLYQLRRASLESSCTLGCLRAQRFALQRLHGGNFGWPDCANAHKVFEVFAQHRSVAMFVQPSPDLRHTEKVGAANCLGREQDSDTLRFIARTSRAYSGDLNRDMDIVGSKPRLLVMTAL